MAGQRDQIVYGNTIISYQINRSPHRSTVAVHVHPDGTVTVDAPKTYRKKRIAETVAAKRSWILRQQEYFRRLSRTLRKRFISGESFLYLGRQYQLQVNRGREKPEGSVKLTHGQFQVTVPRDCTGDSRTEFVRDSLMHWYRARAQERPEQLTQRYARNLGVQVNSVRVRTMQRRWGSARSTGRITYNWKIILAPTKLVEYVVAHEVCHLKYDDHSREFWQLLERALPDFERRRLELAVQGPKYDWNTG